MFPPPIKRFRTDENQQETNTRGGNAGTSATTANMMDDFEMTDDELLFTATQVEQQTNYDYYQSQPSSQNPSGTSVQPPIFSNQTVLQPIASEGNRNQPTKEHELERKLLMKESQILILEKNNRLLSEKNARLNREKCLLKTEQDEAASAREQRIKSQLETCKSQLTFNERERSELQTRYHTLEVRFHESQETSNRLLREVTRLRSEKPSTTNVPTQQPSLAPPAASVAAANNSISNQYRLLQTQLTHFSAYELLRTRTIDSSSTVVSSLQTILDRLRPQSITQHIWQTLVDLIFFHQHNSTLTKLKQQDLAIGIDLITMTAFYQMITNVLNSFFNQKNRLTTNNNEQQQILTHEQLISILDASAHFLFNTVKSTELFNKQENTSMIKKAQVFIFNKKKHHFLVQLLFLGCRTNG